SVSRRIGRRSSADSRCACRSLRSEGFMTVRRTRREFLQTVAAASAATPVILRAQTSPGSRAVSPNDRLRFGAIGVGIRGQQDVRSALRAPGVELAAVADVYDGRLTLAREIWGSQIATTRDYRELLARRDIDALLIATPDHWHRQIAIDAMK